MAHCPPESLDDLDAVFRELQTWDLVVQHNVGVYYLKRTPFLHFHLLAGGGRVADARDGRNWGQRIELSYPASRPRQHAFMRELRRRYKHTVLAWRLAP
jgi:hypothetical protein